VTTGGGRPARRVRDLAVPGLLWAGAAGAARAAGFSMQIPWDYYQLLDARPLSTHPLASLCYLHSQPPGLNALLAAVLAAARLLGCRPESVAGVLFAALGLVAAVAFHRLVLALTGSAALAALGLLVTLADPGVHVFSNLFFYEFVLYVLLVLLVAAIVCWLERGTTSALVGTALLLAAISLTRTLFHPLWAMGLFVLVVRLRAGPTAPASGGSGFRAAAAGVVLLVLLAAWPVKNAIVYGRLFYASMSAYSLARGVPGCESATLRRHMVTGDMPPGAARLVERAQRVCGGAGSEVLTDTLKGDGSGNWNHAVHLAVAPELEGCATAWMAGHPGEWLRRAAGQYAMWTRASFVHPYTGQVLGSPSDAYTRYARAWERALFLDLRPFVEERWPGWFLHRYATVRGRAVPYSVFGFLLLPLLVVLLGAKGVRYRRRVGGATALVLLAVVLWPMLGACLTDGQEGNRMRFATTPLVVAGVCLLLRDAGERPERAA
jgi:hypothetical protein